MPSEPRSHPALGVRARKLPSREPWIVSFSRTVLFRCPSTHSWVLGCWQEDEDRRSQRVLAGLNAAAQFVRDRTEDERIRKAAEHVKWSVNNGFLEEEVYQNVRLVLEEEAKLVSSPDALVEAVGQGAALTADDVDWLTRRMKGGDVFSDLEDAEAGAAHGPNGEPYYGASSSPCAADKVGCDAGDFSPSNSTQVMSSSTCFGRRPCFGTLFLSNS